MNKIIISVILLITLLTSSCRDPFVNGETSEIGTVDPFHFCLKNNAWDSLQQLYPIDKATSPLFKAVASNMRKHWTAPKYILYFKEGPEEIIACEYYSVRLVYNPQISSSEILSGNDNLLSDKEQVRVRNRILNLLSNYACDKGKIIIKKQMNEPAIYSDEYYENGKKWYNIF